MVKMNKGISSNTAKGLKMANIFYKNKGILSGIMALLFFQVSFGTNSLKTLPDLKQLSETDNLLKYKYPKYGSSAVKFRYLEVVLGLGANRAGGVPNNMVGDGGTTFSIGANYYQSINEQWSVVGGLEFSSGTAKLSAVDYSGQGNYTDMENEDFLFKYSTTKFRETWKTSRIGIPIMAEYNGIMDGKIYLRGGFKYSFKISNSIDLEAENLKTSGYFPAYDVEFTEPKFAGFGDFGTFKETKNDGGKGRFSFIFEAGTKIALPNFDMIRIALYFDMGLGNEGYASANKQGIVGYRPIYKEAVELNSIYETDKASKKLKTSTIGIKLTYSFDFL